ncbi:hypothetical protein GGR54DRAFT_636891 [Hypoxylon sp. NC1633]|nr:hypothetical protein GGR54DRAFT_636891 [Hypoxylon sp. NC1633]
MRLTGIKYAALLGLLAAVPLAQGLPRGDLHGIQDRTTYDPRDAHQVDQFDHERVNRRTFWHQIDPRGTGKPGRLGDKPDDAPSVSPGRVGTDNPGSTSGGSVGKTPDSPPAFSDSNLENARSKGEGLQRDLEQALFNNKPDDGNTTPLVDSGYTVNRQVESPTDEKYLAEFPIDYKKDWASTDVVKGESGTIVKTIQDGDQGVLAVKESWNKDKDPNGVGWTTMVMDNWRTTAGTTEKIQGLKYMVRDNIQTIDTTDSKGVKLNTVNAMTTVFDKMKADTKKTLTLDPKSNNPDEIASFQLMAAQTHVARPVQLLKDYHNELGNLKITKLHLQDYNHESRDYQRNIIIEFGK